MTAGDLPDPAAALAGSDRVVFGAGSLTRLAEVVAETGAARVFLVTGRRSFETSGAAAVLPDVRRVAEVIRWSDFSVNVDAADVLQGLGRVRDFRADLVLGIGGGSVMDMAKLLAAFQDAVEDDVLGLIRGGAEMRSRSAGLVLVPTTSGSGSEATHFAVVYDGSRKYSVAGPALRADAVVLDPLLAVHAPSRQRAASGMDAVCQAIESTWAAGATDASRRDAAAALALLIPTVAGFARHPDAAAAEAMCAGSHLAGRAIDVSKTTGAHALSYGLTKSHGIPHGHAVASTLGAFVEVHAAAPPGSLQPSVDREAHARAMERVLTSLGAEDGPDGRIRFLRLLESTGLEPSLSQVGVRPEDVEPLVDSVNAERLGNNPVVMTANDLGSILRRSL